MANFTVSLEPPEVVEALATHCHKRDEAERAPVSIDQTDSKERNELTASHQQEKHIHEVFKLVEKNLKMWWIKLENRRKLGFSNI